MPAASAVCRHGAERPRAGWGDSAPHSGSAICILKDLDRPRRFWFERRDDSAGRPFLLLFAGHETTTHLISGSVRELLRNPGLRDWLEEDWSRAELAVEEFLRFITPVQFTKPRYVRKDIELGGVQLRKGEKIMVMLAAANMDPAANAHPERPDLQRKPKRHGAVR